MVLLASTALGQASEALGAPAKAAPKTASAPAETIPVPVSPLDRRCSSLFPSATVNGRAVSLRVQYCGVVSTHPNGKQYLNYTSLVGSDGVDIPVWPAPALTSSARQLVSSLREKNPNVTGLLGACGGSNAEDLTTCGYAKLLSGDYSGATGAFISAINAKSTTDLSTPLALALILQSERGGLDWVKTRTLVRSLLRTGPPINRSLLSVDDRLDH